MLYYEGRGVERIALLLSWDAFIEAGIVTVFLIAQVLMMRRFLRDPVAHAIWYSGFGVPLFVFGMMASAVGHLLERTSNELAIDGHLNHRKVT